MSILNIRDLSTAEEHSNFGYPTAFSHWYDEKIKQYIVHEYSVENEQSPKHKRIIKLWFSPEIRHDGVYYILNASLSNTFGTTKDEIDNLIATLELFIPFPKPVIKFYLPKFFYYAYDYPSNFDKSGNAFIYVFEDEALREAKGLRDYFINMINTIEENYNGT